MAPIWHRDVPRYLMDQAANRSTLLAYSACSHTGIMTACGVQGAAAIPAAIPAAISGPITAPIPAPIPAATTRRALAPVNYDSPVHALLETPKVVAVHAHPGPGNDPAVRTLAAAVQNQAAVLAKVLYVGLC